jgi:hypothetical protein
VPISLLIVGFVCYAAAFFLRAVRFKVLLPQDQATHHLFPIVLVHYTALNIIPARLGELSYVYLLKKINAVPTGYSLSSLILARVFDQIALSLLFLSSTLFVELPTSWLQTLSLGVGIFLGVTCGVLILLLTYQETCLQWLKRVLARFSWSNTTIVQRILHELEHMVQAFQHIHLAPKVIKVLGLSVGIWVSIFSVNYFLLRAFHVPLSYVEVVLTSTFIILLGLLPLHIVSGIGVHETTWVFITLALGVSRNVAITAAFGTHILSILYLGFFGMYGVWRLRHPLNASKPKE